MELWKTGSMIIRFRIPTHLLPYHNLGEAKNESLGKASILNIKAPSAERMEELKQLAGQYKNPVQIGGSV